MTGLTPLAILSKFILLGFIQGFTEPLPISSSGHVLVIRQLLNIESTGLTFEIIVNFGSLIAILIIYYEDLFRIIRNSITFLFKRAKEYQADFRYTLLIGLSTIITGVFGLIFEDFIHEQLSHIKTVGFSLLFTGGALWIIKDLKGKKTDKDITFKDALIIGAAQAIALIPGVSRAGATIVAAMLVGFKRTTALRFSFLLYIPVSLGIFLLSIPNILSEVRNSMYFIPHLLAWLTALIATYYALKWFIHIMTKGHLKYFAYYCLLASLFILLFMNE